MKKTMKLFACLSTSLTLVACSPSSKTKSSDPKAETPQKVATPPSDSLASATSKSCITSLCGESNPFAHPFEGHPEIEIEARSLVERELKKPLENYMGRLIHKALLADTYYRGMLERKDRIKIKPEIGAFVQSLRFTNKLGQASPALENGPGGTLVLNKTKLKSIFPEMRDDQIVALASLESIFPFILQMNSLMNLPLESVLKAYHPEKTLTEAAQLEALAILSIQNKLGEMAPLAKVTDPVSIVVINALAGRPLSESEKTIFKKKMQSRLMVSFLLRDEIQKEFLKVPASVSDVLTDFEKVYEKSPSTVAVRNPKSIRKNLQDAVKTCTDRLAYAYGALPTSQQKEQFRALYEKIRSTSQEIVEERGKSSLNEQFQMELLLPGSREDLLPDLKSNLQEATKSYDSAIRALKAVNIEDPAMLESIFLFASTFRNENLLDEVLEFCDQARSPALNDAALSSLKMINLSWPTVIHPELGAGIVAHELGHVVSSHWNDLVKTEKSCLTQKQGSEKYLEEDFADLFSTEVTKRMGTSPTLPKVGNFSCALLERNEKGWLEASLKNANANDTHSSSFYRLMAVASRSSRSSDQCQSFLERENETRFENYCEWTQTH